MAIQSFWAHPEVRKFRDYTEKLDRKFDDLSPEEQEKAVSNWSRGLQRMRQIGIPFGVEYNPEPMFTVKMAGIKCVDVPGVGKVGLTSAGKPHWKDGDLHVFNATWLEKEAGDMKHIKTTIMKLVVDYDGEIA